MDNKLSIIIPVYNEWRTIRELLDKLQDLKLNTEIIIVDDASTDGTSDILNRLNDPGIRVISHAHNQGKGSAIRTALPYCTGQRVIIQDADLEQDPEDIYMLVEPMINRGANVVYGSRFLGQRPRMKWSAYLANRFLSLPTSLLYQTRLTDLETCYKIFDREVICNIPLEARGFEFEPEITAKLLRSGFKIHEVPIKEDWYHGYDNNSKKVRWTDGVIALWTLLRFRFWRPESTVRASSAKDRIETSILCPGNRTVPSKDGISCE